MSSSAPWRSETTSVAATSTRLDDIEQRLARLEAILAHSVDPSAAPVAVGRVGNIVVAAAPPEAPLPAAAVRGDDARPAEDRSEETDEFPEDFPDDDDEEAADHHGRPLKRQRNRWGCQDQRAWLWEFGKWLQSKIWPWLFKL